ncbi:MAG: nicotinate (nicotinamide) nucleotide adenylyltransferase, partial [candidate division Zixibacteria bacterium]|nr:nicotinate (nicotinamide) nucleotide adenylyltransferase [candidate division Zixibacteria bacterium]
MPSPEKGSRWGILGGSFDPIHNGHINLANWICSKKELDGVLIVPAVKHPNKSRLSEANYLDRVAMIKAALLGMTKFLICEIEAEESLSGYTIDTIRALKKRFPKVKFYFIIGSDNIGIIDNWYMAEELKSEVKFIAGTRPGSGNTDKSKLPVELVEIPELDISSSEIRKMIKSGCSFEKLTDYVPASAAEYIFKKR